MSQFHDRKIVTEERLNSVCFAMTLRFALDLVAFSETDLIINSANKQTNKQTKIKVLLL